MKKSFVFASAAIVLAGCSKLGPLGPENFNVTPQPLEAIGGKVPATINGKFPEKYMKKKAIVTVTPELRYAGGKFVADGQTFQGEKVLGNDQTVNYKVGGNYTMRANFPYVPEMEESKLYLTFNGQIGKKVKQIPDVEIGYGVLATSTLLGRTIYGAQTATGKDAYQYAIEQSTTAEIKYLIQQSQIRTSELKSVSVQEFVNTLRQIKADQKGFALDNIEVSAYASPDGGLKLNTALAEAREKTSKKYLEGELKKMDFNATVDSKYTAEDWDGFQELVSASNIQDKEVIIRVLSMYEDPEEREQQIKNLSVAFKELAEEVLPALRRARLRVNYELIGRSDEEIVAQFKQDPTKLSIEELLYAATLTDDAQQQKKILEQTAKQYPNDYRAYNNLAQLAFAQSDVESAIKHLNQAATLKPNAQEVNANKALIALAQGNVDQAEALLGQATNADNYNDVLGNICIARGQYAVAQKTFGSKSNTNSAALAQILNKDYSAALKTLNSIANADATTAYLKAIVAARTNKESEAITQLRNALQLDPSLKGYAAKDLEFATLMGDSSFQALVK
ncbi:MAG: tetratricopeptide repeat protein [Bacteroidaceae bacterium]|nr:tetratricopeptide repeat protein [Bacteroidaceae bacterium]